MKRKLCYLLLIAMLVGCTFMSAVSVLAAGDGATFTKTETYTASGEVTTEPNTISATIHVPKSTADNTRVGVVLSNYSGTSGRSYSLEIHKYGRPRLFIQTSNSTAADITFTNLDVRGDEPVRVSVVMDKANGNATCYISDLDGNLIEKETKAPTNPFPTTFTVDKEYMVGGDHRSGNATAFIGTILDVAMYADQRTEAECLAAATDKEDEDMILGFDMTAPFPLCLNDLSGNGHHLTYSAKPGLTFDASVRQIIKPLTELPRTIEAWVNVPDVDRPGIFFGNYKDSHCFNFEIGAKGAIKLYFRNEAGSVQNLIFKDENGNDLVIKNTGWVHLAVVVNDDHVLLYKNGEVISNMAYTGGFSTTPLKYNFVLGGDLRANNVQYFKGEMMNLAAYTDARTAEEIRADMLAIDPSAENLMLYYDLSTVKTSDTVIEDLGPNSYNIEPPEADWLTENPNTPKDYAYSMAVIGDTQQLTRYDVNNGTSYTADIYDWLVKNAESKNMQAVLGLGDITNDDTDAEWLLAMEQIAKLDGVVPYVLNRGNPPHDSVGKYNKYVGGHAPYVNQLDGVMAVGEYQNAYKTVTVGETKYLILMIDWGPTDDALEWAGDVITSHADHRVIITTHGYLYADGEPYDENDSAVAHKPGVENGKNNGNEIWDELVKLYPNIVLVLSGHDPSENIVTAQTDGIYGNTVTQMLVDPQGMDPNYDYRTGMIAMLYFSEDGTEIAVEYISAVRANAGEPCYFRKANQFSVKLLESTDHAHPDYAGTDVITRYGIIPAEYADAEAWPFAIFVPDEASASGYTFKKAAKALLQDSSIGVGATSCALHYTRTDSLNADGAVILMRRDVNYGEGSGYTNLVYGVENVTVDLGGFTFYDEHTYEAGLFIWHPKKQSTIKSHTLTVRNGAFVLNGHELVSYGVSGGDPNNTISTVFENVSVSFAEGATATAVFAPMYFPNSQNQTVSTVLNYCTVDYANAPVGTDLLADGSLAWRVNLTHKGTAFINRKNILPKMSLTMSTGFILNVYVPTETTEANDVITAITLGGANCSLDGVSTVTIEGKQYYKVEISLSPEVLGKTVPLSVDVNRVYTFQNGSTATRAINTTIEVDVIDYLASLATDEVAVNATLGKDILSYVRSAYAYTNGDVKVIERIDGIIGKDYDETAKPTDADEKLVTDGMASARLELSSVPAFIFYPELDAEGNPKYNLESYVFALDGKYKLTAEIKTDESGRSYFYISTYAYAMIGTVEYIIKDTDIHGYYNLKAYHNFATEKGDALLTSLVERLMKYAESAAAYRENQ